jgi:hypothetical protein
MFCDIEDAEMYINNIGAFSTNCEHHIKLIRMIVKKLKENGFTVHPLKYDWAVKETDWLGY